MVDSNGLYVETNGDGGDCPHRTGIMIAYKAFMKQDTAPTIAAVHLHLEVQPHTYIRYPVQWPSPADFSRDQASRLMLGFAAAGHKDLVKGYYLKLLKNGIKHPNGDYLGIGELNNIIRSLTPSLLYPLGW